MDEYQTGGVKGSPSRLLLLLLITIFIAEAAIMLSTAHSIVIGGLKHLIGMSHLTFPSELLEGLADALLLTVLVFPVLYLWVFKKLVAQNRSLKNTNLALTETEQRLEERVEQRTRSLEVSLVRTQRHHREMAVLNEMSQLLQACRTKPEVYAVAEDKLNHLFANLSGAFYVIDADRRALHKAAAWGERRERPDRIPVGECWALRCSRVHEVKTANDRILCAHMNPNRTDWNLCLPFTAQGEALGVMHLEAPLESMATNAEQEAERMQFFGTVAETLALAISNITLREELRQQALRDPLTGLYNRRYLDDTLHREVRRAERSGEPLSLLLLDIDHFKSCNDTFGHDAGDTVLKRLGDLLSGWTRAGDVVSRYGGEEFVALLPQTDAETAVYRADTLRRQFEALAITHEGRALGSWTISAGVAVYPGDGVDPQALLQAADRAMYRCKHEGRNRVSCAGDAACDEGMRAQSQAVMLSA